MYVCVCVCGVLANESEKVYRSIYICICVFGVRVCVLCACVCVCVISDFCLLFCGFFSLYIYIYIFVMLFCNALSPWHLYLFEPPTTFLDLISFVVYLRDKQPPQHRRPQLLAACA